MTVKPFNQYIELQKELQDKYGEKTILLMQEGKFFEIYSQTDKGYLYEITNNILHIKLGKKTSGYFAGFPMDSSRRYIDVLMEKGYIVPIA